jgi:hypothetical protein
MKELDRGIQVTLWKGMPRTLTREMVENAARQIVREGQKRRIVKYFVNIAGDDLPIKQLIGAALEVKPADYFDANQAKRWLQKLGYAVRDKNSEALEPVDFAAIDKAVDRRDLSSFLAAVQTIDWKKRAAAELVKATQYALSLGALAAAQRLAQLGARQHGDDPVVKRLARILAPAKVLRANLPSDPRVLQNHEWLKKHASEYRKRWVALQNGKLLSSGDSIGDVRSKVHDLKGVLLTRIP